MGYPIGTNLRARIFDGSSGMIAVMMVSSVLASLTDVISQRWALKCTVVVFLREKERERRADGWGTEILELSAGSFGGGGPTKGPLGQNMR